MNDNTAVSTADNAPIEKDGCYWIKNTGQTELFRSFRVTQVTPRWIYTNIGRMPVTDAPLIYRLHPENNRPAPEPE
jgi:hypothetical protein